MSLEDTSAVVHSLILVQESTYVPIASAGLFLYDYLLTVHDEAQLVWRAPWSVGKVLFFLTRYPAFVDISLTVYHNVGHSLSVATCQLLYDITGWMFIIGMVIAELIMVIRVWALWGRLLNFGIFLIIVSVIGIITTAISFAKFHGSQTFIEMDTIAPNLGGCFPGPGTNIVFIGYLVLMAYEALVMTLMLVKGLQHFRHVSRSFLYSFYQDGLIYYAFLLLISILNVVVLVSGPPEFANLLTTLQRTLHSLLSARILLHLRRDATQRQYFSNTPATVGAVSSMMFAEAGQATTTRRQNPEITTWFGEAEE